MKEIKKRTIKLYQKDNGECPVIEWLESLDDSIRYRVKSRLARASLGNLGEYKILGDGLGELKFKFGSGYRVYFGDFEGEIVLLLCGGDKATQKKDIQLAKEYLANYVRGEKS